MKNFFKLLLVTFLATAPCGAQAISISDCTQACWNNKGKVAGVVITATAVWVTTALGLCYILSKSAQKITHKANIKNTKPVLKRTFNKK